MGRGYDHKSYPLMESIDLSIFMQHYFNPLLTATWKNGCVEDP